MRTSYCVGGGKPRYGISGSIMAFEKCLFEILAKLGAAELSALCQFVNSKIDLLQNELDKALAFTNLFEEQFNEIEAKVRAGEALFQQASQGSALLAIAQTLGPDCGDIGDVFAGAGGVAGAIQSTVNDAIYTARQITSLNAFIATARNEAFDTIAALRDVCTIIQLTIHQNASGIADFLSSETKSLSTVINKVG